MELHRVGGSCKLAHTPLASAPTLRLPRMSPQRALRRIFTPAPTGPRTTAACQPARAVERNQHWSTPSQRSRAKRPRACRGPVRGEHPARPSLQVAFKRKPDALSRGARARGPHGMRGLGHTRVTRTEDVSRQFREIHRSKRPLEKLLFVTPTLRVGTPTRRTRFDEII